MSPSTENTNIVSSLSLCTYCIIREQMSSENRLSINHKAILFYLMSLAFLKIKNMMRDKLAYNYF
jgi:hypothetical protein